MITDLPVQYRLDGAQFTSGEFDKPIFVGHHVLIPGKPGFITSLARLNENRDYTWKANHALFSDEVRLPGLAPLREGEGLRDVVENALDDVESDHDSDGGGDNEDSDPGTSGDESSGDDSDNNYDVPGYGGVPAGARKRRVVREEPAGAPRHPNPDNIKKVPRDDRKHDDGLMKGVIYNIPGAFDLQQQGEAPPGSQMDTDRWNAAKNNPFLYYQSDGDSDMWDDDIDEY